MEETAKMKEPEVQSRCKLAIADDRLAVLMSCSSETANEPDLAVEEIKSQMKEMKIRDPLDEERLISVLADANSRGQDIIDFVIAKGQPPVMPRDGKLEWSKDYFAEGYYVDPETNAIDYRQKAAMDNVAENELLVTAHPAISGENGRDVCGRSITVSSPKRVNIKAGQNVIWDEDKNEYSSKCSGRVRFRGANLEVLDTYRISGDVGPETGNIHHNGDVKISGDVVSNFEIKATGDIEVSGIVGTCNIVCGGSLTVRGGIKGNSENRTVVKGDANLRYLDYAIIECNGDVHIDVEIHHSAVYACGKLICDGKIIGGTVVAAKGITVSEAGSKNNAETTLVAGVDFQLLKTIKKLSIEREEIKKNLRIYAIEQKKIVSLGDHLNNEQKEALTAIQFQAIEAEKKALELVEEEKGLLKQIRAFKDSEIEIIDMVHQGTILKVLDSQHRVEESLKGPLVASIDCATGKTRLCSKNDEEME